ncbi:helix-turn-helix transcriptional regulator [Sphingomonas sp. Mn802worker]|uniref:helix-turn-helix transcriptional regulator n=1 Tax=Sphingomonas sp. Mn802worker TaxID=629773 RepID=UPI000A0723B1|nr:helix-turn-helix domain-containing protein [Sphingomonas sp. Mn802worker]
MITRVNVDSTPDGRVTRRGAADYLGLSVKTLANYRSRGKGPRCIRVGGRTFYYLKDLEAFVQLNGAAA